MISTFLDMYNATTPDWTDVSDLSSFLGFANLTAQTTVEYLLAQGIDALYISEMVECMFCLCAPSNPRSNPPKALTRVNYGQVGSVSNLGLTN
jgi:hypothetical protein